MNLDGAISGGIWGTTSVTETPELELAQWMIMETTDDNGRHFIGYNLTQREGRVSSAIKTFDQSTMCGVTSSGRVYKLVGAPGSNKDALYVWGRWMSINGVSSEIVKDVSIEASGWKDE